MNDIEVRLDLLYKVTAESWDSPCYVAARSQQQALDKIMSTGVLKIDPYDNITVKYVNQIIV